MPDSEDYTVVWAGLCQPLEPDDLEEAQRSCQSLVERARSAGLDSWFDTFDTKPHGEPMFYILIGARLDILGYKEGRSRLSLSREAIAAQLDRIDAGLRTMGLSERAGVHVLLRIED